MSEGFPEVALGLDLGDKTIGVAASNALGWAEPITVIRRKSLAADLDELGRYVEEREAKLFVLGLPYNMDGTEGPRALKSRRFAEKLAERFGLPIVLWDERLSTFEAESSLREAGVSAEKRRAIIDMVAAQVILKSWLDAGRPPPDPLPSAP